MNNNDSNNINNDDESPIDTIFVAFDFGEYKIFNSN